MRRAHVLPNPVANVAAPPSDAEAQKAPMPEITDSQHREYLSFVALQMSPAEITGKIGKLERDNQKQRDEIRDRDKKLEALPAEGAVVLTGDDAKEWEAVKALNAKASDLKKGMEERDALKVEKAGRDRRDALGRAVGTEGWAPESATLLARLLGETPVEVKEEDVDVTENGKTVKKKLPVGYVTVDGKSMRLSEWATKEELPASLFAASTAKPDNGGRTVPDMRGNGGMPKKEPTDEAVRKSVAATVDYNLM